MESTPNPEEVENLSAKEVESISNRIPFRLQLANRINAIPNLDLVAENDLTVIHDAIEGGQLDFSTNESVRK